VLYLLVEFAKKANAVIFAPIGPMMFAAEEQPEQLAVELQADAIVLSDGEDIEQVLGDRWHDHLE
jgi:hypothetical protein